MGAGSVCPALPAGPDVDFWPALPERVLHRHGVPVHHLQYAAGDVHLRVPLSPPEKGITSPAAVERDVKDAGAGGGILHGQNSERFV